MLRTFLRTLLHDGGHWFEDSLAGRDNARVLCHEHFCRVEEMPSHPTSKSLRLPMYANASHTAASENPSRLCVNVCVYCCLRITNASISCFHKTFFWCIYSRHLFSWRSISLPGVALNVQFVHVSPQVYYICFSLFRWHYLYCWLVPIVGVSCSGHAIVIKGRICTY